VLPQVRRRSSYHRTRPTAIGLNRRCDVIRAERGGAATEGREKLRTVLDFLRKGGMLMVTHINHPIEPMDLANMRQNQEIGGSATN
jgi:hypothetical protein